MNVLVFVFLEASNKQTGNYYKYIFILFFNPFTKKNKQTHESSRQTDGIFLLLIKFRTLLCKEGSANQRWQICPPLAPSLPPSLSGVDSGKRRHSENGRKGGPDAASQPGGVGRTSTRSENNLVGWLGGGGEEGEGRGAHRRPQNIPRST